MRALDSNQQLSAAPALEYQVGITHYMAPDSNTNEKTHLHNIILLIKRVLLVKCACP